MTTPTKPQALPVVGRAHLEHHLVLVAQVDPLGQLGAGGRQPRAGDGRQQGDPAAAQEEQQRGQSLLASVMRQGMHGQLVWQ